MYRMTHGGTVCFELTVTNGGAVESSAVVNGVFLSVMAADNWVDLLSISG